MIGYVIIKNTGFGSVIVYVQRCSVWKKTFPLPSWSVPFKPNNSPKYAFPFSKKVTEKSWGTLRSVTKSGEMVTVVKTTV